ncbi:MAG TPA: LamG-like jellyroll fold domain-containing protein [Lacipirellula sp.]
MFGRAVALALALWSVCLPAFAQPALRYTFDESSGVALDVGTAPLTNAAFQGGAIRSTNVPSGAGSSLDLRPDSPFAYLRGENASDLNGLTALTITTWLNVEVYASGNHRLASQQSPAQFGGFSWNMNPVPNDGPVGPDNFRIGLFVGNNLSSGAADFGSAYSTADVDAASKWVFLAVTYDSAQAADNVRFYIGDVSNSVGQLGSPGTAPQLTIDAGAARFGVGYTDAAPAFDTSVKGMQDDVRVYNLALDHAALDAVRLENIESGDLNPADFDNNQFVDQGDLNVWKANFGTVGAATKANGDADDDMDADGADFLQWQRQVGYVPAPLFAIPEPTAGRLMLFTVAVCSAASGRLARRRPARTPAAIAAVYPRINERLPATL